MLILVRNSGESIYIDDDIKLTIYYSQGTQIKMAIEAPSNINIVRKELLDSVKKDSSSTKAPPKAKISRKNSQVEIRTKRKKRIILPTV